MISSAKLKDFFTISVKGIAKRRMRSWLTMVGIFIGAAAVVALVSLGQGLQNTINAEFEQMGMDKIMVTPGGSVFGAGGVDALTDDDVKLIRKVRDVESVVGAIKEVVAR